MSEIKKPNPDEIFLSFYDTDEPMIWKVRSSDTAPFISDEQNPEWYVRQSVSLAAIEAKDAHITLLVEALKSIFAKDESGPMVFDEDGRPQGRTQGEIGAIAMAAIARAEGRS